MLNKYYKYLPWLIVAAIGSYQSAKEDTCNTYLA